MGTPAAEFEPPGTKQIGVALLERGTFRPVAENRQLIKLCELRGACQRDELVQPFSAAMRPANARLMRLAWIG
ncbi:hypothetical protein KQH49_08895 [Mycetohabitans sp. B5]|uniref:Uncharacterized protein n=1 Tax=Mycetohabitans endofungorum TaxID=417203 RepID=A0A2P5K715_9BURK|nr:MULTISPECIES: hypothetical protein [Mycetohabitans]MCG1055059.1 hypothetical protein [Mycetohabitans sp. B5]PPB81454.1 hypothetical protein B0O95_11927 [Mycetohabitans endofungorum]